MKRYAYILSSLLVFTALAEANGPVMTSTNYEITVDNVDAGGASSTGYAAGTYFMLGTAGEAGGITVLSGGTYTLNAGYLGQDLISPMNITSLNAAINVQAGALVLSWSAPGDDYNQGQLLPNTRFFISSTTVAGNASNPGYWNGRKNTNSCDIVITTGSLTNPINPGDIFSWPITGLVQGMTYYFRVWTLDQACNWSDLSSGATMFFMLAPGAITNLAATQGLYGKSIQLSWTVPTYYGTLPAGSKYAIQRSTWSAVTYSTSSVDTVYLSTGNITTGTPEVCNLTSLQQGVTYYIAAWTADNTPNWSSVSNTTSTWATWIVLSLTLSPTYYNFGTYATGVSTDTSNPPFNVSASGANYYETYQLSAANPANWVMGSSPGQSTFELQAVFNSTRPVISSDYGPEDVLTTTPQTCTNTTYAVGGSSTGVNVDPFNNPGRSLWFKLSTPLSTGATTQQNINFTVTATPGP